MATLVVAATKRLVGGLRGALSMVIALSLPDSFPSRDRIITTTFGVVVLSILVRGSATAILTRRIRASFERPPLAAARDSL